MNALLSLPQRPKFRPGTIAHFEAGRVEVRRGEPSCSFHVPPEQRPAVSRLIRHLEIGDRSCLDLTQELPEIGEQILPLLADFDRLRFLTEAEHPNPAENRSGAQLYREIRRLADRVVARNANGAFYRALTERRATRQQLIGYALEYYWIVRLAPGLIAPAVATSKSTLESQIMQEFLRSELGHDVFLSNALQAVGYTKSELDNHQPLPTTFALCASLGVYARQDPLSFKASLFLFEQAQPAFIEAFEQRCREIGLPDSFYGPLRTHASINESHKHEDISRSLLALVAVVDAESCVVVKRHVALLIETLIQQEEQILDYYGQPERCS